MSTSTDHTIMDSCKPQADNVFGPKVVACRQGFDFTLFFEQAILSAIPSALVLLVSSFYVLRCYTASVKTTPESWLSMKWIKQLAVICFAGTQLALVVLWSSPRPHPTRASLPASVISLAGAVAIAILSYVHHDRSVRPSAVLCTYLLVSALLDLGQARTLCYRDRNAVHAGVFMTGLVLKLAMLFVEAAEKRRLLKPPYSDYPPEALSGIVNRSVFWWLNSLLMRGSSRSLRMGDLFDLDQNLLSEHLHADFCRTWAASRKRSPYSLLWTAVRCACKPMLASVAARVVLIAFKFFQPLLINRAVSLLTEPESQSKTDAGRALVGATALVYLGIALVTGHFTHNTYRFITMFRGGLICLIYNKTLDLDASSAGDSAAVTLMSTDIDRIATGFELLGTLLAGPIEVAIGVWLLYLRLGVSCMASVLLASFFIIVCLAMGRLSAAAQKNWLAAVQRRVAVTSSTLGNIKGIKMTGLSQVVESAIHGFRVDELRTSKRFRWLLSASATISNMSMLTIATITITVYVLVRRADAGVRFDATLAFTSISLISLISSPVQEISVAVPQMAAAIGCFQRIQTYLLAPSHQKDIHQGSKLTPTPSGEPGYGLCDLSPAFSGNEQPRAVLSVRAADFAFKPASEPVLHDIDFTLPARSWTILLGPVGSGKSSFLLALLGELVCLQGAVHRDPRFELAYCAQEPWLPNLTVRQIITGSFGMEGQWYSDVVHACALDRDIQELPQGDKTLVGSNAVSLSGGQRQRLSLARSLYSRKRLLLLDDVLSGLDPTTEQLIVDRVFGPNGLCRRNGLTVLLATHSVRHVPRADYAAVMTPDGRIAEQAVPHELSWLQNRRGDCKGATVSASNHATVEAGHICRSRRQCDMELLQREELQQDLFRQSGDARLYGYYLKAMGWSNAVGLVISDGIFAFCVTFPTVWLKWWSEEETDAPGTQTTMYMTVYGMFSLIGIVSFFTVVALLLHRSMPRSSLQLHSRLLAALMAAPHWFFVSTDSGQILNRFSQDMTLIDMQLPLAFLNTIYLLFICVMQACIMASTSKWSLPMYPVLLAVLYMLQRFYLRTSRQLRLLELEAKSPLYSHFSETLSGLTTIRAFVWQQLLTAQMHILLNESQKPFYLLWSIQRWLNFVLDCIVAVVATVIMALATQAGDLSAGSLGVALVNILTFSQNLTLLIRAWVDLETSLGAVARVRNFENDTPCEKLPQERSSPPANWPTRGEIQLRDFSASYRRGGNLVLQKISLFIQQGAKIGICGRTGSGKSSFMLALLRLVEIEQGDILINGLSLADIPRDIVRRRLTVMPQDPLLLTGTIRFNIDPWQEHSDETIELALHEVGLWDIILERGGIGVEMDVCPLSRGQQQLFCLARALLSKSQVLVLDEATSSLDEATQAKIMEVIRKCFAPRTVLVVAHHLHTVRAFDQIIVLDGGRVVESGPPDELLSRPGNFRALWNSQD